MRINTLKPQTGFKTPPWTNFILLVFLITIISCSTKDRKSKEDEIEAQLKFKTDSVYKIVSSKYKISYKLDTLQHSYFKTTLFYQRNIKAGDFQLIELDRHDISDIYVRDSTYYLTIWENDYSNLFIEVSFDQKDLQKLLEREVRSILIVNIDRVKKIHFELNAHVTESDPSSDYYATDLNLANSRKVLLTGSVKEIFFINKKLEAK